MSRKIALVAGISNYSGRWSSLQNCANDADEMATTLTFPEYDFDVTKILDDQVTKQAVIRWLLDAKVSGADEVLFYFAGHGVVNDINTYLVTADNQELDEGIPLVDLMKIVEPPEGAGTEVVIILDCCHSGQAVEGGMLTSRRITNPDVSDTVRQVNPSAVVMAACTPTQKAKESTNLAHGVFTYHLLEALMGAAADHNGEVTVHSLYEVVSREMDASPGTSQNPVFGGRVTGRVILGNGFTPVLAAPRPEQELAMIELEANEHLESYNRLRSISGENWRESGYAAACRKLEAISAWFSKQEVIEGLPQRKEFRQAKSTLLRFQSELGVVEPGTKTRWGILESQVGIGGFGKVWRVRDDEGNLLAYKIYHANELTDREKVKRFRNGYDAMRMLDHPAIVNVHDYSDSPPGFVMDYIEGSNLRELAIGTFLEPADVLAILLQSAEAIEDAHAAEVIHRDIKPENIVCRLQEDGTYKPFLTDFDLAWFSTQTQKATKTAMGVVYYAAPEQYFAFNPKAARERTPALDIYSFGQLIYFCFANNDPDPVNIDANSNNLRVELLKTCPASVASSIIDLYRACTRFVPADRIQSFREVIATLQRALQSLTHTDNDGKISKEEYIREVAFQVGSILFKEDVPSFSNASGLWEVFPSWKTQTHTRTGVKEYLWLHCKPTDRVALENISNERMRIILNRKIDAALSPYGNQAKRQSGKRGEFEFFMEWHPSKMTRSDCLKLCEALRSVFGNLQV